MKAQEYSELLTNFDPKSEDQRKVFEKITYRYLTFNLHMRITLKHLRHKNNTTMTLFA